MRLHDERTFEAPADALFALLTDPSFEEARARHLGAQRARCERRDEPLELVLEEARETGWPTEPFESRRVTTWDPATRSARWTLVRTAGPGDAAAEGTLEVRDAGPGRCRLVVDGTLTVRVRFLGPMIERLAVAAFRTERAREAGLIADALRQRAG